MAQWGKGGISPRYKGHQIGHTTNGHFFTYFSTTLHLRIFRGRYLLPLDPSTRTQITILYFGPSHACKEASNKPHCLDATSGDFWQSGSCHFRQEFSLNLWQGCINYISRVLIMPTMPLLWESQFSTSLAPPQFFKKFDKCPSTRVVPHTFDMLLQPCSNCMNKSELG